jgi:uncharacterized protein YceH (UPF0502 family)
LCPDLHPLDAPAANAAPAVVTTAPSTDPDLAQRVEQLESEVASLKSLVHKLADSLGVTDG